MASSPALPEEFRDVLVAVDVVGLDLQGDGRPRWTSPEGTVMSRLYRARKRVIAELA